MNCPYSKFQQRLELIYHRQLGHGTAVSLQLIAVGKQQ